MNTKETKYIDLSLFSGSADTFRTAIGGYWETIDVATETTEGTNVEFNKLVNGVLKNPYLSAIKSRYETAEGETLIQNLNDDMISPNYRFPVRVLGNSELLHDDAEWKAVWLGGTWGSNTYSPIYNTTVFDNNSFQCNKPYSKIEESTIGQVQLGAVSDVIEIAYDYNKMFTNYQTYAQNIETEKLLPNMYGIQLYDNVVVNSGEEINSSLQDFVSLGGVVQGDIGSQIEGYLNVFRPSNQSVLMSAPSSSVSDAIKDKFENIIFANDQDIMQDVENNTSLYPFCMKIKFSTQDSSDLISTIENVGFENKLVKSIKEVFTNQVEELVPEEKQYAINQLYYTTSSMGTSVIDTAATETQTMRQIDLLTLAGYAHNSFRSTTTNCCFMEEKSPSMMAAMDETGDYRFYNTVGALRFLNKINSLIKSEFVNNLLYGDVDTTGVEEQIGGFHKLYQSDMSPSEVILYRIQKVGGAPTGDLLTQRTLQNFWFLNRSDLDDFVFYDSQVKYGTNYTYNVYAYVVNIGYKYSFSDLAVTRQIAELENGNFCLEFYDPNTGEPSSALYSTSTNLTNEFATDSQRTMPSPYAADFYVNVEPSVQLVEVPIFSKTLQVLDNPPNVLSIDTYQFLDDSQRIGFSLKYQDFTSAPFPLAITPQDDTYKDNYMHANDILPDGALINSSVSPPKTLEIYRLSNKPLTIKEFQDNLIATIDLRPNSDDTTALYSTFNNRIDTNQKYYYLFRVLNQQGAIGQIEEIYEAELVSDGGYKYALFDVIFANTLAQSIYSNPTNIFKKLLHLQPNISQLTFDTTQVDYESAAATQLENLVVGTASDSLWGKKFKIRLTSKKTGKKIDLNITYNLSSE